MHFQRRPGVAFVRDVLSASDSSLCTCSLQRRPNVATVSNGFPSMPVSSQSFAIITHLSHNLLPRLPVSSQFFAIAARSLTLLLFRRPSLETVGWRSTSWRYTPLQCCKLPSDHQTHQSTRCVFRCVSVCVCMCLCVCE